MGSKSEEETRSIQTEKRRRSSRGRWLFRIVRPLLVAYVALCLMLLFVQRKLLFIPDPRPVPIPALAGIEDVVLTASDGVKLHAWYVPGERSVTLVIFHGNAGTRGGGRARWIEDLRDLGAGVFILDYRGYGGSEGSPSEEGFYRDAEAAIGWLEERGAPGLVYLGESIGSGVAVEMAVRRPPAALILQSAFTSVVDAARSIYPWMRALPLDFFVRDRFDNLEKIARVSCPSLHLHGRSDSIIPFSLGEALFAAACEPKELWGIEGAGHNDLLFVTGDEYYRRIDRFLRSHVEAEF